MLAVKVKRKTHLKRPRVGHPPFACFAGLRVNERACGLCRASRLPTCEIAHQICGCFEPAAGTEGEQSDEILKI